MICPIYIQQWASISPLGNEPGEIWDAYGKRQTFLRSKRLNDKDHWCGQLNEKGDEYLRSVEHSDKRFRGLDRTVLMALYCARSFKGQLQPDCGINIGSSRGATGKLEHYFSQFSRDGIAHPVASPHTTAGNVATWVGQYLDAQSWNLSHSITCSTALHALVNAVAWLRSGMAQQFVVGGTEAPNTPFTLAQVEAMRIYTRDSMPFPVRAMDMAKKHNTMTVGEGAALFLLSDKPDEAVAQITGLGYCQEPVQHGTSVDAKGEGLYRSMKQAMYSAGLEQVDAIVTHSPGTVLGDRSEFRAMSRLFGEQMPPHTNNKWIIGHTYGASGALSLEMALLMLRHQRFIPLPWSKKSPHETKLRSIMVNAQGFGGNSVSVIVQLPDELGS